MSFEGLWRLAIATPIGKQDVELRIDGSDGQLLGTATQGAETVPLLELRQDGEHLRWSQNVTQPLKLSLKFDLIRDGDAHFRTTYDLWVGDPAFENLV